MNLITVSACEPCHDGFKLDDEYFRLVLSIRPDVPNETTTKYLLTKTVRSLQYKEAKGLQASVLASIKRLAMHSPAGTYLGEAYGMKLDFRRLNITAQRIIKGFFAHYRKVRLPDTHRVTVYFNDLQKDTSAIETPVIQELLNLLGRAEVYRLGGSIVEIRSIVVDDDQHTTAWFIRMIEAVSFFAFTHPR